MDFLRSTAKVDLPTAAFEMLVFRRLRAGACLKCLPEPCQPTVGSRTVGSGSGILASAARMGYDFFMGLAVGSAIPIAVAAALLCAAPLRAQNRSNNANPKRLIEKADRLAWLYNWYMAGPVYAEAEKL